MFKQRCLLWIYAFSFGFFTYVVIYHTELLPYSELHPFFINQLYVKCCYSMRDNLIGRDMKCRRIYHKTTNRSQMLGISTADMHIAGKDSVNIPIKNVTRNAKDITHPAANGAYMNDIIHSNVNSYITSSNNTITL